MLAEIDRRRSSVSIQRSSAGARMDSSARMSNERREERRETTAGIALKPTTVLLNGRGKRSGHRSSDAVRKVTLERECHSRYAGRCGRVQPASCTGCVWADVNEFPRKKESTGQEGSLNSTARLSNVKLQSGASFGQAASFLAYSRRAERRHRLHGNIETKTVRRKESGKPHLEGSHPARKSAHPNPHSHI